MRSPNASIRRARRAAKSIVGGTTLLSALTSPRYIALMKTAVEEEVPPVSMISSLLTEELAADVDLRAVPVKQFIGMAVKAILEAEGFEVMETGVRIAGDPVFRSGATYQPAAGPEEPDDLLARFVAMLSVDELHQVQRLVLAAL
ncbi:hypothetical protein [Mesorhizobium sp. CO1-1-8]|uniref:hypothetical protein n=1 Tax=Mesorhizobium sp. CO1-1-8 TaxID=2876631 RepID=UPI001CD0590B|nr:hypothetical protein [Mesorhizobium sp. CO1-1-8]MBZ9772613.1 hypothetical protein [Mesorhizobium sp. CO1-1-8]